MNEKDQPMPTIGIGTELPSPSRSVLIALERLAETCEQEHGLKNGKTALYWHLYHTVQIHLKGKTP